MDDSDYTELLERRLAVYKINGLSYAFVTDEEGATAVHRIIMADSLTKELPMVDHINGNTLDNRKSNLRVCTHAQNMQNRKMHKNNKSGYKGVYFQSDDNRRNPWRVEIKANKRRIQVGSYATAVEAAGAYNDAALTYHGVFAKLNIF